MVIVYSKNNCMACKMTKKMMDQRHIPFTERNIDNEPKYLNMLKIKGIRSLPAVVDGKKVWTGFRPSEILKIKQHR